jgi:hypothetical protein
MLQDLMIGFYEMKHLEGNVKLKVNSPFVMLDLLKIKFTNHAYCQMKYFVNPPSIIWINNMQTHMQLIMIKLNQNLPSFQ